MEHIWKVNEEERTVTTSGQAHAYLTETGEKELMKSRAAVIVFLNENTKKEVIEYEEETGRGGYHRAYCMREVLGASIIH